MIVALLIYGFVQSKSDYSLFCKQVGDHKLSLLMYVDEILVASDSEHVLNDFKNFLAGTFKLKDLGATHYLFGLEIIRLNEGIIIN